jgi:hypothetical protein
MIRELLRLLGDMLRPTRAEGDELIETPPDDGLWPWERPETKTPPLETPPDDGLWPWERP